MSDTNSIAVIIPSYNQGAFLKEAVESVYAQKLQPTQVIIVNDGSTDDTEAVVQLLQQTHPSLQYFVQANAGVAEACRTGLNNVTAEYVVRLDADDKMPDNYLEELSKVFVGQPPYIGFAYCSAQLFGAKEGWIKALPWSIARLAPENYIHVSSLVRTEVAKEVGYFSPDLKDGYEDWDFYLSLAEVGYRGVFCQTTFLWYRQKPEGGRNTMDRNRDRALRAQIQDRHPQIYRNNWYRFRIFLWRVGRRLRHWVGKA